MRLSVVLSTDSNRSTDINMWFKEKKHQYFRQGVSIIYNTIKINSQDTFIQKWYIPVYFPNAT